ncbi:hypothetical protein [Lysobacter hankyongensis]|uniref:hypothetical protein n=1 Tax=Lysobacter hankyongensis TaxID=1176535 RepID=UPI0031E50E01
MNRLLDDIAHQPLAEAGRFEFEEALGPVHVDTPSPWAEMVFVVRDLAQRRAFDAIDRERAHARTAGDVIQREAQAEDLMELQDRLGDAKTESIIVVPDPFEDEVDIEDKLGGSAPVGHDAKTVHMDVVPLDGIEIGGMPAHEAVRRWAGRRARTRPTPRNRW